MASPINITIARAGIALDHSGVMRSLSIADLAAAASAYDPDREPAPIVVGDPTLADPAVGWIGNLVAANGQLVASLSDTLPAFNDAARSGRYAKIAASWYMPATPPTRGQAHGICGMSVLAAARR